MAVKTVTNANLSEYVAEQKAKGSQIAGPEEVAKEDAKSSKPTTGVVATGEETIGAPVPPPDAKPTAQTKPKEESKGEDKENPFKERIKELTDKIKESDEFAQGEYEGRLQAQKRISELEAEIKRLTPKETKQEELKPPDPKAFTSQSEYDRAVEDYQNAIIDKRVEAKLAYAREQERQVAIQQLLDERYKQAAKEIDDFETIAKTRGPNADPPPPHILAVFQEWETGVKLAYHFLKYPEEAKRISAMRPAKALEELARLDRKYAKQEPAVEAKSVTATPPPETRAPPPMTQLKSSGESVPTDLSGPMTFGDYRARRMAEIRKRRQEGRRS